MIESRKRELHVSSAPCGQSDSDPVYLITIANDDVVVEITNFGAIITGVFTPDKNGIQKNIVAGYQVIGDYKHNPHYFGCLLGRYAGRIAGSKFELDGDLVFLSSK